MTALKTTQDYQEKVEQTKGIKAVLFTQFNEPCARCNKAISVLKNIKKPAMPLFEFSAPQDAYPLNELKITTVPTLVIFKDNKVVSELSGFDDDRINKYYTEAIHVNY